MLVEKEKEKQEGKSFLHISEVQLEQIIFHSCSGLGIVLGRVIQHSTFLADTNLNESLIRFCQTDSILEEVVTQADAYRE